MGESKSFLKRVRGETSAIFITKILFQFLLGNYNGLKKKTVLNITEKISSSKEKIPTSQINFKSKYVSEN